ncbi:MAG: aldose epimerase family protein [bacterium]|nr:aldose epimerase family protein [bacterium]
MITKKPFGRLRSGQICSLYTIDHADYKVSITDFGATIVSLVCPDKYSNPTDIVLGFDSAELYSTEDGYLGATVGRFANRLGGAKFTLDNTVYNITANEGPNQLHGGAKGFSYQMFNTEIADDKIIMSYHSADGEEGFPGNLKLCVTFSLSNDGNLSIEYSAVCDKDTVVNFTNHSYFNLNGATSNKNIKNHTVKICADQYCELNDSLIATGQLCDVKHTALDLRNPTLLADTLDGDFPEINRFSGYDFNFVLSKNPTNPLTLAAVVECKTSGISLSCLTTLPGIQFYTSNGLNSKNGKGGINYTPHYALCLETQSFPNSPNIPHFPSARLRKGERFNSRTDYKTGLIN